MTCSHVLGLIDAGPFADHPRAHLDAARRHARGCVTCGPALEASRRLDAGLATLPQLVPSRDFSGAVLARLAQVEPRAVSQPAARNHASPRSLARAWPPWATVAGGVAAAATIALSAPLATMAPIEFVSLTLRGMTDSLIEMPSTTVGALGLTAGLGIYMVGMFAAVEGE